MLQARASCCVFVSRDSFNEVDFFIDAVLPFKNSSGLGDFNAEFRVEKQFQVKVPTGVYNRVGEIRQASI